MRLTDDGDFVDFKVFDSEEMFKNIFSGEYGYDTEDPMLGDLESIPTIWVRGSEIESVEAVDANTWYIGAEAHSFILVRMTMKSGKEHLVLAYDFDLGLMPISQDFYTRRTL